LPSAKLTEEEDEGGTIIKRYDVLIKVVDQQGTCGHGHKVGDEWLVANGETPTGPKGICMAAFGTLHPFLYAMLWGLSFPWEPDPDVITVGCPDTGKPNRVLYELSRLKDKTETSAH